ncbi:unnamed protein product [Closterium sp. NIES-53]
MTEEDSVIVKRDTEGAGGAEYGEYGDSGCPLSYLTPPSPLLTPCTTGPLEWEVLHECPPPISLLSSSSLPPFSFSQHSDHDQVAAGGAAGGKGGLSGGCIQILWISPYPSYSSSPLTPSCPPTPPQNTVNVTRWLLDELQLTERGRSGQCCTSPHPQYSPFLPSLLPSNPLPPSLPQNTVNVMRWLLDELQLTEEDTVIVKMDIEGVEWANTVNVTRWLLDELHLTEEDTVIVKMDIEGAEWAVLHEWLAIPCMPAIVDELFVEVHYHHPSMEGLTWTDRFNHTLDDTTQLLTDLRRAEFYVHPWP